MTSPTSQDKAIGPPVRIIFGRIRRFLRQTGGASQVEYALILLVVIAIGASLAESISLSPVFNQVGNIMGNDSQSGSTSAKGRGQSSTSGHNAAVGSGSN